MKHVIILSLVFIPFFSFAQEAENTKKNNEIYQESPPEFPGGMRKFYSYVYKEMTYPKDAKKNSIQGKVLVQFEIGTNGKVTPSSIKIVQGLTESIDAEARRIMEKSPKWTPGYQNDKPVKVTLTLPITFKY